MTHILTVLLAAAAASDLATRRIPNALAVAVFVCGIAAATATGAWLSVFAAAAAAFGVGIVLVLPWRIGALGGGDVKLAAAVSACVGVQRLVPFIFGTALAGGLISLAALTIARARAPQPSRELPAGPSHDSTATLRGITVPYGVAIALGGIAALWWRP